MKDKKYSVAIVGAGSVGSGADGPDSSEFLTHAHGIAENPSLELCALVDIGERAEAEAPARHSCCREFPSAL